ncbi:MAG: hypothetical protein M3Q07_27105, partial [Pseudobdellovibrionaceae bacterium]|nr:hypothetical protein [Pseudobdellovibrionaceae bacterium]
LYFSKVAEKCGAELYFEQRSPNCEVEAYNERQDKACGSEMKNVEICSPPPNCPTCEVRCRTVLREVRKTCRLPEFGIESYQSCRHSSHGIETYASCRLPEFGIEQYNECSFYKTPEEIDAYIEATNETLVNNATLLPAKQSELYTTFRHEASFICLVEKYNAMPGYEDVVNDLTQKFFGTFGYEYNESSLTCADASTEDRNYKITAGTLDCANYDISSIRTVAKPDNMVQAVFSRFKVNCTTKVTYDYLVRWFDDKLLEVNQLLGDLVAIQDANRKRSLEELKQAISESK